MDVAGSRIHMRAVGTMPLLHLEEPQYAEAGAWPKLLFDRIGALFLLVLFAPFMVGAAIAVKLSSPVRSCTTKSASACEARRST